MKEREGRKAWRHSAKLGPFVFASVGVIDNLWFVSGLNSVLVNKSGFPSENSTLFFFSNGTHLIYPERTTSSAITLSSDSSRISV